MDGLGIHVLAKEWNTAFAGARIDKVHQPTARELVITVRAGGKTTRLLLSAHRQLARAHTLQGARPTNPQDPPMFCMLLRRRMEGGRITRVWQPGWERILNLEIESQNELGDVEQYLLSLEMMGKHSNLIFCSLDTSGQPSRIVDSIVHVTQDMSRVRPILPGRPYTAPPPQDKATIDALTQQLLEDALRDVETTKQAERAVMGCLHGAGPDTVREAMHRATFNVKERTPSQVARLFESLQLLYQRSVERNEPATVELDQLGQVVAAAPFRFSQGRVEATSSFDEATLRLYESAVTRSQFSAAYQTTVQTISEALDKLRGKRVKLEIQQQESLDSDTPRICGELLMAYAYQVQKGASSVDLPNFYDENRPLTIALDPALTATQNATHYFKLGSKRKRALPLIAEEILKTNQDIDYLESVLQALEQAEPSHFAAIRGELERQGFLTQKRRDRRQREKQGKTKHRETQEIGRPDEYVSSDGFKIRVGRNNMQNDRLTLRSGQPHDIWLHVKDAPGSHVVIETGHREVPESTLFEAALLAAYFSRLRTSVNVPVDYTETRHVWKPNGARPGHVLYDHQKTLYATPDKSLVDAFIERSGKALAESKAEAGVDD